MFSLVRIVLIDLSGTLHIENQVIPGAKEALERLRNSNVKVRFVTNTTKESTKTVHDRLKSLGFNIAANEIHSSLKAARDLVAARKLKPFLFLSNDAMEEFKGLHELEEGEKPNAVVIGLAPSEFYYKKMNEAFKLILNGASLIAVHSGKYYKTPDGLALGPGCFVKGLEYSTKTSAEIVGKPSQSFFESALGGIPPSEAIMIGDDVSDDIEGAVKCGMFGILVQTGKYRDGDEVKINPKPTLVVKSFVEAVEKILQSK